MDLPQQNIPIEKRYVKVCQTVCGCAYEKIKDVKAETLIHDKLVRKFMLQLFRSTSTYCVSGMNVCQTVFGCVHKLRNGHITTKKEKGVVIS